MWKTQIEKNHGAAHKSTIYQREYRREQEYLTTAPYNGIHTPIVASVNPNDGASLFI